MNPFPVSRYLARAAALGLLGLISSFAVIALRADTKSADAKSSDTAQSQLGKDLVGTWVLVGKPGEPEEAPSPGSRLKFIADHHWSVTQCDPKTGLTIFHHGGTYTLNENEYVETVEYANQSTSELIKQSFKFNLKLERDTLTCTGIGNPWTEVWKRAK
jgi:hypothetical protein